MSLSTVGRLRLFGAALVLVLVAWLGAVASGILAPEPDPRPVPVAVEPTGPPVSTTPTPIASAMPTATLEAVDEGGRQKVATRIVIPELGIDLPIYEGDGYTAELGKAAHYPTTSWPGSGSLIYLYAHARDENFVALWDASLGDIVELELDDGSTARYEVRRIVPDVRWNDLSWLEPTPREVLRLQTCNSYEETAPRFIVEALPAESG